MPVELECIILTAVLDQDPKVLNLREKIANHE